MSKEGRKFGGEGGSLCLFLVSTRFQTGLIYPRLIVVVLIVYSPSRL